MSTTMSGLRVYINSAGDLGIDDGGTRVFYSRRGNGPVYRWLYEEKRAQWRALRMPTSDFNIHKLCNASWKSVPETLQVQLGFHYLD
jgi:hypothetical protein